MRTSLLDVLRCPACGGVLTAAPFEEAVVNGHPEIIEGVLTCACGATYPIVRRIPRVIVNARDLFAPFYARHRLGPQTQTTGAAGNDPLTPDEQRALDRTRRSFGYQWTHFSEMATDFRQNFLQYIEPVNEAFFEGKRGVDVGCGFGRHIYNAALFGAEMVGVDISDAIEATAKNTAHLPNVQLVQADIYRLPFVNGAFDFAYSIGVLHHLPDPEQGFTRVTRLVKPGGAVFIWVYSSRRRVLNFLLECARSITTRVPRPLQNAISLAGAIIDWSLFIVPYRLLASARVLSPRLANLAPRLRLYTQYPFQVVWADWFDRLAAPIRFYYDGRDLEGWLSRASLTHTTISPTGLFGWRAYGERR